MALQVFLNATLRQYAPGYNPVEGLSLEVPAGTTMAQVLSILKIPAAEVALLLVDGRHRKLDFVLQGHERLGLFPPIGGG
jgi:molybdopterin synthase sulfur carrier subunit